MDKNYNMPPWNFYDKDGNVIEKRGESKLVISKSGNTGQNG